MEVVVTLSLNHQGHFLMHCEWLEQVEVVTHVQVVGVEQVEVVMHVQVVEVEQVEVVKHVQEVEVEQVVEMEPEQMQVVIYHFQVLLDWPNVLFLGQFLLRFVAYVFPFLSISFFLSTLEPSISLVFAG